MKGIIVVNIPECCRLCDYCGMNEEDKSICIHKYLDAGYAEIEDVNKKPDWCPIKPLPEKMDTDVCAAQSRYIATGYNACIDKILKGNKENEKD